MVSELYWLHDCDTSAPGFGARTPPVGPSPAGRGRRRVSLSGACQGRTGSAESRPLRWASHRRRSTRIGLAQTAGRPRSPNPLHTTLASSPS